MLIFFSTGSIVFCGVVLCVFLVIFYSNQRKSARRKKHQSTHSHMSDADFLANLNVEVRYHDICVDIRKAVARVVKVPAETLHPSESDIHLTKLGLTFESLMLALGSIGSYDIDFISAHKLAYSDKSSGISSWGNTLGDLIRFILNHLEILKVEGNKEYT